MKAIELNERGEDVTDYNRGYREGYDAARKQLRDEIAMRMLPELFREYQAGIRNGEYPAQPGAKENLCVDALRWADAMLKAREEV